MVGEPKSGEKHGKQRVARVQDVPSVPLPPGGEGRQSEHGATGQPPATGGKQREAGGGGEDQAGILASGVEPRRQPEQNGRGQTAAVLVRDQDGGGGEREHGQPRLHLAGPGAVDHRRQGLKQ